MRQVVLLLIFYTVIPCVATPLFCQDATIGIIRGEAHLLTP